MIGTVAVARLLAKQKAKEAVEASQGNEPCQPSDENVTTRLLENDISATLHYDPFTGIKTIEGTGKCIFNDTGSKYKGAFHASAITGAGKVTWKNGDAYTGLFCDGYRHGNGILLSSDHSFRYEGEWLVGKRHGFGTSIHGDKLSLALTGEETVHSKYIGSWENDCRNGQGREEWSSGQTYEGEWLNDQITGSGCMHWPVDDRFEMYSGAFQAGQPHGFGEFTWPSMPTLTATQQLHNKYIGNWNHGKRHGRGIYLYADGSSYDGEWSDDNKHGLGQFTLRDGRVFKSEWTFGIPATPVPTEADATLNPLTYLVDIDDICSSSQEKRDILSHLVKALPSLKVAYLTYKKHLTLESAEDSFALTTLQFWNLLRDIDLITPACSLVTLCRAIFRGKRNMDEWRRPNGAVEGLPKTPRLYGGTDAVDVFSPDRILLFRHFVESLVRAAITRYSSVTGAQAVKRVLEDISLRRYVSDSVFGMWSDVRLVVADDLWNMFALRMKGRRHNGRVDVTMTLRELCTFLLKKGLLRSSFDKAQLEEALKVEARQHSPSKAVARKSTGLDEISISEGSLLGALRVETSLVALKVEDVEWNNCFTFGSLVHAAVQVISPANVGLMKLNPLDCNGVDDVSLDAFLSYELCFFEFVRILYTLVEVRSEEVHGLKVDVDVTERFRDFVSKVLSRERGVDLTEEAAPEGWYKLKLDVD